MVEPSASNSILAQAITYISFGRLAQAACFIEESDDAVALVQLAVWRMIGSPLPRDLAHARALLRRATTIGHVDAALMEVALTANGSGGVADWAAAQQLLSYASGGDAIAKDYLDIVGKMAIDEAGWPKESFSPEVLSESPRIARYRNFFSKRECSVVARTASELLEPSTVLDPRSSKRVAHPIRTSDGGAIGPTRENLVIRALNMRIAAASGTDVDQGEPLTVLRYRVGQQYKPHLDTITGVDNQRRQTMLVYLNEDYFGGETEFPFLKVTIQPRAGDAILFNNVIEDGSPDARTRHAGLPVRRGVKWLASRWIRQKPIDPWTLDRPN